jgi:hypothetical protein
VSLLTLRREANLPSAGVVLDRRLIARLNLAHQIWVLIEAQLANYFHSEGIALQDLGLGFQILRITRGRVALERKHFASRIDLDSCRGFIDRLGQISDNDHGQEHRGREKHGQLPVLFEDGDDAQPVRGFLVCRRGRGQGEVRRRMFGMDIKLKRLFAIKTISRSPH